MARHRFGPWGRPRRQRRRLFIPLAAGIVVLAVAAAISVRGMSDIPTLRGGLAPISAEQNTISGTASVIDGDTIEIHGTRIRLYGIDAPESAQLCLVDGNPTRCGQSAAFALADKIGARPVVCDAKDRDVYGRTVAICSIGGENLNAWMTAQGWALAYRQYSTAYVSEEEEAQAAKRGMWRGDFIRPWDWRHQHEHVKGGAAVNSPGSTACNIKGNISATGQRIYHVPGGAYYDKTVITPSKGEQWFCTEAEARAAGWRRSMR